MVSMEDIEMLIISKADLFSEATIQYDLKPIISSTYPSKTQYTLFSNKNNSKKMIDCFVGYMKETILVQLGIDQVTLNVGAGIQKYPKSEINNLRSQSFDENKNYKAVVQNSGLSDSPVIDTI
uniref:Uncharacterized protein n=1 Tax=Panagrolaimus sp. PS1159 TaxID=55785 RepID=A0AC35EZM2_9BILA